MTLRIRNFGLILTLLGLLGFTGQAVAQEDTSKWKLQLAFGLNSPGSDGFVEGFEAKPLNFPSIQFGIQHMLTRSWGAKLDYGYYRFSEGDDSMAFKTNYSRINAQVVYDATFNLDFLPLGVGLIAHAGPGYTFVNALGNYDDNDESYLNLMAGIEIHYNVSETFSIFTDFSYMYGLSGDQSYDPVPDGFGTFNGNLFAVTVGLSVSLSGCYYCD